MNIGELTAHVTSHLRRFTYPPRDWMLCMPEFDHDVAIIGTGYRAIMLAYMLRRERITNVLMVRSTVLDLAELYAACLEPPALPRLDLTGTEFSFEAMQFRSWLSASGLRPESLQYPDLTVQWRQYLEWLRETLEVPVALTEPPESIAMHEHGCQLGFVDGHRVSVRRLVIASSEANQPLPESTGPKGPAMKNRIIVIVDTDDGSHAPVLTALAQAETRRVVHVTCNRDHRQEMELSPERKGILERSSRYVRTERGTPPTLEGVMGTDDEPPGIVELVTISALAATSGVYAIQGVGGDRWSSIADLIMTGTSEDWRVAAGTCSYPVYVFGEAARGAMGDVCIPSRVIRHGALSLMATLSRSFMLEDEEALLAQFSAFSTPEGFGGILAQPVDPPESNAS